MAGLHIEPYESCTACAAEGISAADHAGIMAAAAHLAGGRTEQELRAFWRQFAAECGPPAQGCLAVLYLSDDATPEELAEAAAEQRHATRGSGR